MGNDGQFRQCCQVIGRPELSDEKRFATNPARVVNRESLIAILEPIFHQKTSAEWVEAMLAAGIPAGPINDIPAIIDDPHVQARGLVQSIYLADGTPLDLLTPVARLSATPAQIHRPPPLLGADTENILREVLALDTATIQSYREQNII